MDADPRRNSDEDTDEPALSTDHGGQSSAHARSYDCSFCKRGFSNAQALGGHMNIHRKDRAKLKQPFDNNLLSFNISDKVTPSYPPLPESYMPFSLLHGGDDGGGFMSAAPWIDPRPHGLAEGKSKLPLFDENPYHRQVDNPWERLGEGNEEMERSGQGPVAAELDLELRLGFEPPDASTGLKEFF